MSPTASWLKRGCGTQQPHGAGLVGAAVCLGRGRCAHQPPVGGWFHSCVSEGKVEPRLGTTPPLMTHRGTQGPLGLPTIQPTIQPTCPPAYLPAKQPPDKPTNHPTTHQSSLQFFLFRGVKRGRWTLWPEGLWVHFCVWDTKVGPQAPGPEAGAATGGGKLYKMDASPTSAYFVSSWKGRGHAGDGR